MSCCSSRWCASPLANDFDVYYYRAQAALVRIQREQALTPPTRSTISSRRREPARLDRATALVGRVDRAAALDALRLLRQVRRSPSSRSSTRPARTLRAPGWRWTWSQLERLCQRSKFTEAVAKKSTTARSTGDPRAYMASGDRRRAARRPGVSVAESISNDLEVVTQIKIERGRAYVRRAGRLIAHPDISWKRNTDMSKGGAAARGDRRRRA
jgi:hypothetical protein